MVLQNALLHHDVTPAALVGVRPGYLLTNGIPRGARVLQDETLYFVPHARRSCLLVLLAGVVRDCKSVPGRPLQAQGGAVVFGAPPRFLDKEPGKAVAAG